jgi:hypothetical protein
VDNAMEIELQQVTTDRAYYRTRVRMLTYHVQALNTEQQERAPFVLLLGGEP